MVLDLESVDVTAERMRYEPLRFLELCAGCLGPMEC